MKKILIAKLKGVIAILIGGLFYFLMLKDNSPRFWSLVLAFYLAMLGIRLIINRHWTFLTKKSILGLRWSLEMKDSKNKNSSGFC